MTRDMESNSPMLRLLCQQRRGVPVKDPPVGLFRSASHVGAVERVRQNFMSKQQKDNSVTTSQTSIDSKDNDLDEDDSPAPAFSLDSNEKQWILRSCRGELVEMRKLLDADPALADKKDFIMGYTALHWAAKRGNRDMASMLLDQNVRINTRSNGGYTPLHLAAMQGHEEIIILLLEAGADPNIRDFSGHQPVQYIKSLSLPLHNATRGRPNPYERLDFSPRPSCCPLH